MYVHCDSLKLIFIIKSKRWKYVRITLWTENMKNNYMKILFHDYADADIYIDNIAMNIIQNRSTYYNFCVHKTAEFK